MEKLHRGRSLGGDVLHDRQLAGRVQGVDAGRGLVPASAAAVCHRQVDLVVD